MIDFHAHVLPGADDGAADVSTAVAMLEASAAQGVARVVATPHFYAAENTVDQFLARRQRCYEQLLPRLRPDLPEILLGAEVLFTEGMSQLDLRPLCIQGTRVLLVELPFRPMPYWLYDELEDVILGQKLTVVFAHLDRYRMWYSLSDLKRLMGLPGVAMQVNAEAIFDKRAFRHLRKTLPETDRLVFGSDMHDMQQIGPRLQQAEGVLSRCRSGKWWLECATQMADTLLKR